jgi:hypothetical protein
MGLFDGYFNPQQFGEGGGLLARLLSLQQQQGRSQPGAGFDEAPSAPQVPVFAPGHRPMLAGHGQASFAPRLPAQDLKSQYAALVPILGDRNAMIATVNPEVGNTLIAQALASQKAGNTGYADPAGYSRPVVSDASPDPVTPGSQYAQAPMALCAAGPVGCALGGGITAGQILGGAALLGGAAILNNNASSRPPTGSRPINETGWSADHTKIKSAVGAGAHDDVRISPTGEVWAQKPDGSWENHGPADTYTGSGRPGGRRGKDRDR